MLGTMRYTSARTEDVAAIVLEKFPDPHSPTYLTPCFSGLLSKVSVSG